MSEFPMFIEKNFLLFFTICLAWTVGGFVILYLIKRAQRAPVSDVSGEEVLFAERGASGFSHKTLLARLGGARHCLNVVLGRDVLTISIAFPFSLVDAVGTFDLHHAIPIARITRIAPGKQDTVVVDFRSEAGGERHLELTLSRREEFLKRAAELGCCR